MQKQINLGHLARLAEHLDAIGEREAAVMVRSDLASMRLGEPVQYERLLHVAAELVHDGDTQLHNVREQIATHITAQRCEAAAAEGGGAVGELVDAVIVMAVRLMAPYRNASRAWPAVGDKVVCLGVLPELAAMDDQTLFANTAVVQQIDPGAWRARVEWPTSARWVGIEEIAAVHVWRQPR